MAASPLSIGFCETARPAYGGGSAGGRFAANLILNEGCGPVMIDVYQAFRDASPRGLTG